MGYIGQAIIGVKVPNCSHVASIQHGRVQNNRDVPGTSWPFLPLSHLILHQTTSVFYPDQRGVLSAVVPEYFEFEIFTKPSEGAEVSIPARKNRVKFHDVGCSHRKPTICEQI